MTLHSPEVLRAVLRKDFGSFLRKCFTTLAPGQVYMPNWHIDAIVYQLERLRRGEITRLIINMPPRSLKSMIASVAFPAFVLGHDPTGRMICVSYSSELAKKFSNDFRALIGSPWYRGLFPNTSVGQYKDSETEIELTQRGFRLATSIGGTLTGRGANYLIIDDPLKAQDAMSETKRDAVNEFFGSTLMSRLDNKREDKIVVVMQRVHMDDLTGHLLKSGEPWVLLNLPAIASAYETIEIGNGRAHHRRPGDLLFPQREPQEILDRLKASLGSAAFAAQYLQEPIPPGGLMIKREWVRRYTGTPHGPNASIIQSWDTAARGGPENDWSACTTWVLIEAEWFLAHAWRGRVNYPDLKAKIVSLANEHGADRVLIEEAGTAQALLDELRQTVRGIIGVKPTRDKESRMASASAVFESGQVYFPERASWLPDLERELFSFPGGAHDDQVDSISQAINYGQSDPSLIWARVGPGFKAWTQELERQRIEQMYRHWG